MIFITVYKLNKNLIKIAAKRHALFFCDSESLTKAVLFLLNKGKYVKSSLYTLKCRFVLIIEGVSRNTLMALNEFCYYKTENTVKIEIVTEYGKPLIINNAIKRYGVAFSKSK